MLTSCAVCDLRVVEDDAVLGVFCRRWGVPLIDGGTVRLPRLVGLGRALDLILTGRSVDAAEALAIGLARRVLLRSGRVAGAGRARVVERQPFDDEPVEGRAAGARGERPAEVLSAVAA